MPQTPPAHFMVPRKLTDSELAQAIRLDLEAELDAMNLYQSHIDATDHALAKKVLAYVRDDEREHAALFNALLRELDPQLAEEEAAAPEKLKLIESGASEQEVAALTESGEGEPAGDEVRSHRFVPRELTVGSLRGGS